MHNEPLLTGEAHHGEEKFFFEISRFDGRGFLLNITYNGHGWRGHNGAGVWPSIERAKEIAQQTAAKLLNNAQVSWREEVSVLP